MATKTEAQKRAQSNYMEKFSRFSVRMIPDFKARMMDHAAKMNESANDFVIRAITEAMERDQADKA